jgi:hypothetical protein
MFQISEVQEAPAFNGGRSFLALRGRPQESTDRPASFEEHLRIRPLAGF